MSMADTVRPIVLKFGRGIVRNAPHILMGLGTGSSLMALIFAVKDAPKARELWLEAKQNKAREVHPEMDDYTILHFISQGDLKDCNPTIKETILLTWKVMGPAAAMELIALICFWAAHGIDIRRQAVLAGLCATAEDLVKEYQKKLVEALGPGTDKEIRNNMAQEFVDRNPPPADHYLESDTERDFVFKGQYFRSSYLDVKNAQNEANREMIQQMYLSESELMWFLDPERKRLKPQPDSGQIGWSVDKLLVLDIQWVDGPKHQPVGVITVRDKDDQYYPPKPGFSRML